MTETTDWLIMESAFFIDFTKNAFSGLIVKQQKFQRNNLLPE